MKTRTFRSIVAMMVIFFAVSATSCKKESEITPDNGVNTPIAPTAPVVSVKPRIITTTENGSTVRSQLYEYDSQGKLIRYSSKNATSVDSVILSANSVAFKKQSSNVNQVLSFNPDKTFKSLFSATSQINFVNTQTQLGSIALINSSGASTTQGNFNYTVGNLTAINSEATINFNYYDNLPYQKGINELPILFKPIQFYKVMEQEQATATTLYNKLLRNSILDLGSRQELHEYVYAFDANNRVTKITDTFTKITSGTSTQKVSVSTITY